VEVPGHRCTFTSTKTLMALEQVVPVVPQGTFCVMTRKVPLVLVLPPQ
jgi:hypothetical protein